MKEGHTAQLVIGDLSPSKHKQSYSSPIAAHTSHYSCIRHSWHERSGVHIVCIDTRLLQTITIMSLLHRWSLPSRGFIRDKSQDGKSSDRIKFPTIHIGQPGPRRRANLSSAFSTLFEKPENRRGIGNSEDHSQDVADLPLSVHLENVPPDTNSNYSHAHTYQDTTPIKKTLLQQNSRLELARKQVEVDRTGSPSYHAPGALGQATHQVNDIPKTRSLNPSSIGTHDTDNQDESRLHESTKPTGDRERTCSASSCYPSEGIRSPVAGLRSPEPATTRPTNYFTEYRRYGRYPSRSTWQLSSMGTSEASTVAAAEERIQAALGTRDTASSPTSSPFIDPPGDCTEPTQLDTTRSRYASTITHRVEQQQKPSSTSEFAVPVLGNDDALSSQLDVSFMRYKRPTARSTPKNGIDYLPEARNARSTDRLRHSVDTDRSILTAVRHTSLSDEDGAWSTIRDVGEKRLSRPASWMQLFTSTTSHVPSDTLAQRMQKLRLRKWVKRVCFKTKARFKLVGRPIPRSKRLGVKVRQRKRHRKGGPEEEEELELESW
ncbi:hypothetical protein F4859DRAFT_513533 [Xylaria cf. heliscus]|nr:hypothetical protein F4859DRAFT_513533 [Xylaria cf. heliscus]